MKRFGLIVTVCMLAFGVEARGWLAPPQQGVPRVAFGPAARFVSMPGEIDGAVHTLTGIPLAGASVQVVDAGGATRATLNADGTGHFRVELLAGTYVVVVSQAGYIPLRVGNVIVTPGSKAAVNFSLTVKPPSASSGAILHRFPLAGQAVGEDRPLLLPQTAAKPAPQSEEMVLLHPAAPPEKTPPTPVESAPPPEVGSGVAPDNPVDQAAAAQAKAAEQGEQEKQQAVQAFVKSLPKGLITYRVPLQMHLNQPVTVTVSIFGSRVSASVAAAAGGTAPAPVPTSNLMQVFLSQEDNPDAFSIEQVGDQARQWVFPDSGTTWTWTVTPKVTGPAKLTFQTYVFYPDSAGAIPKPFDVKDETVTVTTPTLGEYFQHARDAFLTNPAVWFEYVLPGGTGFVILVWLVGRWKKKKATN